MILCADAYIILLEIKLFETERKGMLMNRETAGSYIIRLSRSLRNAVNDGVSKLGEQVTGDQGRILGFIADRSENGFIRQKDIEERFGVNRSSVTSMLSSLERAGYILRIADPHDSRCKRVMLTERGKSTVDSIHAIIDSTDERATEGMTEDEVRTLVMLLKRAYDNLK